MISKQYIKELDFETIEDLFNYILDSEVNGNINQCKELINKLSKSQFKEFIFYLRMHNINQDRFINFRL
jgi:hypothetical protein